MEPSRASIPQAPSSLWRYRRICFRAREIFHEFGRGASVKAVFEEGSGKIVLRNIPESGRMLVAFMSREAKLGAMFLEVERLINAILEAQGKSD